LGLIDEAFSITHEKRSVLVTTSPRPTILIHLQKHIISIQNIEQIKINGDAVQQE
jgi:hypothetical protein